MGRCRVDKTIHYDLENIRSTAPHFIDFELGSSDFIWNKTLRSVHLGVVVVELSD